MLSCILSERMFPCGICLLLLNYWIIRTDSRWLTANIRRLYKRSMYTIRNVIYIDFIIAVVYNISLVISDNYMFPMNNFYVLVWIIYFETVCTVVTSWVRRNSATLKAIYWMPKIVRVCSPLWGPPCWTHSPLAAVNANSFQLLL